jgi:gamma-glutamyltranspeptidase/glutathione hydrolase
MDEMRIKIASRREFLRQGSAALLAGTVSNAARRHGHAAAPADDPQLVGGRQAVACSRREAAEAARDTLRQGGNAIDAAVAALLVQCVVEPSNVGIGGYGGSLVYYEASTNRVHAIDFTSRAPRKFAPDRFTEESGQHGYLAVGTPGIVAGIELALARFGTLPFKSLSRHAVALADNGIVVTPGMARAFHRLDEQLDPVSRRAYFPNGVPSQGSTWVQADLARLIRRLGDEGPRSFYQGDIARAIAKQVQAGGGVLAEEDFRDFQARIDDPLHIGYRGHDLYTPPLPSGGLTSLSILKTLEQFDLFQINPWGAEYIALFTAAANQCWAERFKYFGDPEFVKVPVAKLLSDKQAAERAAAIRRGMRVHRSQPADESHTVNLVVSDNRQNIVSWTATHGGGFGAHVAINGLGLMLGHGMSRFSVTQGDPNSPVAGKRPQHNMSPLVILRNGKPYAGLGLPGGRFIVTVTAQLAVNLIDFGASPQHAVSAPRCHTEGAEPILITADAPGPTVEQLGESGYRVNVKNSLGGSANAVVLDAASGSVQAAASGDSSGVLVF